MKGLRKFTFIVFFEDNQKPHKYKHVDNVYNLWKNMFQFGRPTAINVYNRENQSFVIQLTSLNDCYNFYMHNKNL